MTCKYNIALQVQLGAHVPRGRESLARILRWVQFPLSPPIFLDFLRSMYYILIMRKRIDIKKILSDEDLRREMMVNSIIAIQAREGIITTKEQALRAYSSIGRASALHAEGSGFNSL